MLELVELPDPHPAPGQIRIAVRAAGVNPIDWKLRGGMRGGDLPQQTGREAAGVVDEVGEGVSDAEPGDEVFGFVAEGGGAAELAVLSNYAPIPPLLDFAGAAGLPVAVETAWRTLDLLGVRDGSTVLINGAAGAVGSSAVQLARLRGARVIGRQPNNHDYLRSLGAEPTTYGDGLVDRVRELAPDGVDAALDAAGGGALPALVELAGNPDHVVTIADYEGAQETGARMSGGPGASRAAARHRPPDRGGTVLTAGGADLSTRRHRRGAPAERGGSRTRQARASCRLIRPAGRGSPRAAGC